MLRVIPNRGNYQSLQEFPKRNLRGYQLFAKIGNLPYIQKNYNYRAKAGAGNER